PPAAQNAGNSVRIVLLDQSQSMAAAEHGVQAFERARAAAAGHLTYAPGLSANLVLAAAKPRPTFPAPSGNFTALREALGTARPCPERLNLRPAIESAAEMLTRAGPNVKKELIVVSDFQRSDWSSADFSLLPKDTAIRLESVAPPQSPANLAVLRVAAQGRVEQDREVRL